MKSHNGSKGSPKVEDLLRDKGSRFWGIHEKFRRAVANGAPIEETPVSRRGGKECSMHIPQTLDQSASIAFKKVDEHDADQTVYRFTDTLSEVRGPFGENLCPKLLMVSQLWLWRFNGM